MPMRYVRVPLNRQFLANNGLSTLLFCDMLSKFPLDARIIGFYSNPTDDIDYMYIKSDFFDEVSEGTAPPDVNVEFIRYTDGREECTKVDFVKTSPSVCVHNWKEYIGIYDKYNYCTKCNEKEHT